MIVIIILQKLQGRDHLENEDAKIVGDFTERVC